MLAIEAVDVTSPVGDKLFHIDKLHVFQGDRLVILGRNGTGKSQFIGLVHRAMTGAETPGMRVSPQVVPGYVDQAMSFLPARESPLGYITGRFDQGDQRSKSLLAAAGFAVEKQERPIAELSFGQRARLGLLPPWRSRRPDGPSARLCWPGRSRGIPRRRCLRGLLTIRPVDAGRPPAQEQTHR